MVERLKENIEILRRLPGVNADFFEQSVHNHLSSILCMGEDLIEVIAIYDSQNIAYVKESGIIDFILLSYTKEEALKYAEAKSNVIQLADYLGDQESNVISFDDYLNGSSRQSGRRAA